MNLHNYKFTAKLLCLWACMFFFHVKSSAQVYQSTPALIPSSSVQYLNGYKENDNFLIFYPKSAPEVVNQFLKHANNVRAELELQLENKLPSAVRVYLYPNKESYIASIKRIQLLEPNAKKFLQEAVHWYYSPDQTCNLRTEYELAKQILFGSLYGKTWQDVILSSFQSEIPEWLEESAAHLIVYGYTPLDEQLLAQHLGFATHHEQAGIYDGKSFLFFLLNEFGWENFMDFLYLCRLNQDFEDAIFYIYNIPVDYIWQVARKELDPNYNGTLVERIKRDNYSGTWANELEQHALDSNLLLPFEDTIELDETKFYIQKDTLYGEDAGFVFLEKQLPFHPKAIFECKLIDTAFAFQVLSDSGILTVLLSTNYTDWWIESPSGFTKWEESPITFTSSYWLPFEYNLQPVRFSEATDTAKFVTLFPPKPFRNKKLKIEMDSALDEFISVNRFVITNWSSKLNNQWQADPYILNFTQAPPLINPVADAEFKLFFNDYLGKYDFNVGGRLATNLNAIRLFGNLKNTSRKKQKQLGGFLSYEKLIQENAGGTTVENRIRIMEVVGTQSYPILPNLTLHASLGFRQTRLRPVSLVSFTGAEPDQFSSTYDGTIHFSYVPKMIELSFTYLEIQTDMKLRAGYAELFNENAGIHGLLDLQNHLKLNLTRGIEVVHFNRFAQSLGEIDYAFLIGGTQQLIFPSFLSENTYDPRFQYGFINFGGVNRGFKQNKRNGNSVLAFNTELQIQLFQSTNYPKGLRTMKIGLLWDASATFNGINRIGLAGVKEIDKGSIKVSVEEYQLPYLHSLGGFIRLPLFGYDFEISYARGLENGFWNEKPQIFLRMGHAF